MPLSSTFKISNSVHHMGLTQHSCSTKLKSQQTTVMSTFLAWQMESQSQRRGAMSPGSHQHKCVMVAPCLMAGTVPIPPPLALHNTCIPPRVVSQGTLPGLALASATPREILRLQPKKLLSLRVFPKNPPGQSGMCWTGFSQRKMKCQT